MRTIDADALYKDICDSINEMTKIGIMVDGEWLWAKLNDALENAPTIEPERKTGKWECSDDMFETAICSVCKWDTVEPWQHIKIWFKFCPNCGADMRQEGGSE